MRSCERKGWGSLRPIDTCYSERVRILKDRLVLLRFAFIVRKFFVTAKRVGLVSHVLNVRCRQCRVELPFRYSTKPRVGLSLSKRLHTWLSCAAPCQRRGRNKDPEAHHRCTFASKRNVRNWAIADWPLFGIAAVGPGVRFGQVSYPSAPGRPPQQADRPFQRRPMTSKATGVM